jgi:hypothetical protein
VSGTDAWDLYHIYVMRAYRLEALHEALNRALSQLFGKAGRLKSIEPVDVFALG